MMPVPQERTRMIKRIFLVILMLSLMLSGCVQPTPNLTQSPSTPRPTDTEQPLPAETEQTLTSEMDEPSPEETAAPVPAVIEPSPLYKTNIFEDGGGWAIPFDHSAVYNTSDFGVHWVEVSPPDLKSINEFGPIYSEFLDGEHGWICQTTGEAASNLFITADKGSTWTQASFDYFPCGQLSFANEAEGGMLSDLGVAAGSQYVSVSMTDDGGLTWQQTFTHEPASLDDRGLPSSGIKNEFVLLNSNIALVGGSVPISGSLYLYRTQTGGDSWSQAGCSGLPDADESELTVVDLDRVGVPDVIVSVRSYPFDVESINTNFCLTTDAGATWEYLSTLPDIEFSDFGSLSTGLAYGNGKLYLTQDGAKSWQEIDPGLDTSETAVLLNVVNDDLVYLTTTLDPVTLDQNLLYKSENAGIDWEIVPVSIDD